MATTIRAWWRRCACRRSALYYGAQHELEITVAERIQACVPCAERVAFTSSGSEAVQLVQRLARAFTKRPLILKFEGHYHGWMDSVLHSHHPRAEQTGPRERPNVVPESMGQVGNAADNVIVAPWNDVDILDRLLSEHADKVAAIIMEPPLQSTGSMMHGGDLSACSKAADQECPHRSRADNDVVSRVADLPHGLRHVGPFARSGLLGTRVMAVQDGIHPTVVVALELENQRPLGERPPALYQLHGFAAAGGKGHSLGAGNAGLDALGDGDLQFVLGAVIKGRSACARIASTRRGCL